MIIVFGKILPSIYLHSGEDYVDKKDYISASKFLNLAHILNPLNSEVRNGYIQALVKLKPTLTVQKEVFNIYKADVQDGAHLVAEQKILQWKKGIMDKVGPNYIEKVPFDGKIVRWDRNKMPITVCIEPSTDIPKYYIPTIQSAFVQWEKKSKEFVSFKFTNDIKNADIQIEFIPYVSSDKNKEGEYSVAYTTPDINGEILEHMSLKFYKTNILNLPFTTNEIYGTALHEIGHTLGIMGHSETKGSVMYMNSEPNSFFNSYPVISDFDLNTLYLLYNLIPDATNTPKVDFDSDKLIYAPIVMGTEEQISNQKVLEADNYIKQAPNVPNGYIDKASALMDLKQYNQALIELNKALQVCSNDDEKFLTYYNISIVYMQIKDWKNVIKYATITNGIREDVDVDGLLGIAYFSLKDRKNAIKYCEKAVKKDPKSMINSYNLATIYIKGFNLLAARRVLKQLQSVNPEAIKDARFRGYLIFMIF